LPDGRIGELFLDGGKVDALSEMARESAIVVSLALQSGCSIETLRHALSGRDEGPISAALALAPDCLAHFCAFSATRLRVRSISCRLTLTPNASS
jgi:hypothetical protein